MRTTMFKTAMFKAAIVAAALTAGASFALSQTTPDPHQHDQSVTACASRTRACASALNLLRLPPKPAATRACTAVSCRRHAQCT